MLELHSRHAKLPVGNHLRFIGGSFREQGDDGVVEFRDVAGSRIVDGFAGKRPKSCCFMEFGAFAAEFDAVDVDAAPKN